MRKIAGMLALLLLSPIGYADDNTPKMVLDTVAFQVTAKQWVSTKTAILDVNLNATLTNADLVQARADIMDKLSKIAKGEWHLLQFDRSQDSSGLEKLLVLAEARVGQESLTSVYQNAKSVSKPGATYTISSIDFKPSLAEVQQAKNELRATLYQQAFDELARLNKVFSGQTYSLNELVFVEGDAVPEPRPYMAKRDVNAMAMGAQAPAPALTVSNELMMTAIVQAASIRK